MSENEERVMVGGNDEVEEVLSEDSGVFQQFAGLLLRSGASVLYCISAAFILVGMYQLIGPALANSERIGELIRCVSVLAVYELALLGVLVLIVRFRNVLDDAVSLVILVGVFLTAGGIAVDTIALTGPAQAASFGAVCLGLALLKLTALRTLVGVRLSLTVLAGLSILMVWNYMMAPHMGHVQTEGFTEVSQLRHAWQQGWLLVLVAFSLILFGAVRTAADTGEGRPLLVRPQMAWSFVLLLALGCAIHQFVVAYSFGVDSQSPGDYFALAALVSLVVFELSVVYGIGSKGRVALVFLPLVLGLLIIASGAYTETSSFGKVLIGYPPFIIMAVSVWFGIRAVQLRQRILGSVAALHALTAVFTWGVAPDSMAAELNWSTMLVLASLIAFAATLRFRDPDFAMLTVLLATVAGVVMLHSGELPASLKMGAIQLVGLIFGTGMTAVYIVFGRRVPASMARTASILLVYSIVSFSMEGAVLGSIAGAVLMTGVAVAHWYRSRDYLVIGISLFPILREGYGVCVDFNGWFMVTLSFVVLMVGAFVSMTKPGRRAA